MKKVFITGATGCIGHYVCEELLKSTKYELHIFTRSPHKIKFKQNNQTIIHNAQPKELDKYAQLVSEMNIIIHIATAWAGKATTTFNIDFTKKLLQMANEQTCEKFIYLSTASIINKNNQLQNIALTDGTSYIRSKAQAYIELQKEPKFDMVYTIFPTAVLGGNNIFPQSHLYDGFENGIPYFKFIRWINLNAGFHFMHTADIAQIVKATIEDKVSTKTIVTGNPFITFKEAIKILCQCFNIKIFFNISISNKLIYFILRLFRIKLTKWDTHCIKNPIFKHKVTTLQSLGLTPIFPTFESIVNDIKKIKKL